MPRMIILMMLLVLCLLSACTEGGSDGEPPDLPQEPATPQSPVRETSEGRATPKSAATAQPANTPVSVSTPLAVLLSYTPEPTSTAVPRPTATPVNSESVKEQRAEYITRCKHWALSNMEPIEYSRFERLDPYNMSDLERVLWGGVLLRFAHGQDKGKATSAGLYYRNRNNEYISGFIYWCQDYWSEPLGAGNASKRNSESDRIFCTLGMVEQARGREERTRQAFRSYGDSMAPVVVNQPIRILNWMDIDGLTLLNMEETPLELVGRAWDDYGSSSKRYAEENRSADGQWPAESVSGDVLEWWGIEDAWAYNEVKSCKSYYPQLFFGRWVPLDDFGTEEQLEEAREELREARDSDDWPDWAEARDRDIIIKLEKRAELSHSPAPLAPTAGQELPLKLREYIALVNKAVNGSLPDITQACLDDSVFWNLEGSVSGESDMYDPFVALWTCEFNESVRSQYEPQTIEDRSPTPVPDLGRLGK